ncbi:hypothetical protein KRZ98_03895 [Sphingobium sp. AS12]|uniref:hypothetical protein n=1 Tax=Sphingobium sp. AS12 TaxID=2849495 RepID=UPI001C313BFD|nr:hypothetical protein [Sphingobium sp. AS12]MBV2147428.1 hypothetical protein [Sphingobium sp. AS12]
MTDRRAFITGLSLAPIIVAAPAMAMTAIPLPDPVAAYWAAWHGINDGTFSKDAFAQAMDALDYWEPVTQRDFIRKVVTMFHDRHAPPPDDRIALMIRQGKRLVGEA